MEIETNIILNILYYYIDTANKWKVGAGNLG